MRRGRKSTVTNDPGTKGGMITIRMPREDHLRVADAANRRGVSINGFCMEAVLRKVREMEITKQEEQ